MSQAPRADEIRKAYLKDPSIENQESQLPNLTGSANYVIQKARQLIAQSSSEHESKIFSEKQLFELLGAIEEHEQETLSELERNTVVASLMASLQNYDILEPLINNSEINDIIVKSYNNISIQKDRKNFKTDLSFTSPSSYKSFLENLLKRAGKSCTTASPVVDAAIDSQVRACVTHESFSPAGSGPMLTLRISRHKDTSLRTLHQHGLAPALILKYLQIVLAQGRRTILIAGEVGTGKTTLVKALANSIPEEEAILIIEDTHELNINRNFVRTLLTRENNTEGRGKIAPSTAIRTGMRMAMNRVILGEMRDAEAAEAFIDVCASGHSGLSTIHAKSTRDAVSRLEIFLLRAQQNVEVSTVRRQIANALSIVVHIGLDFKSRIRRILEIVEVETALDGVVQVSPIFKFAEFPNNSHSPLWKRATGISQFDSLLRDQGLHLPMPGDSFNCELGDLNL